MNLKRTRQFPLFRKNQAFTILELLVTCALTLLLLTLIFGYLLPAAKATYLRQARSQAQQSVTVAMNKILQATHSTSPGGFSWSLQAPVALAFNPTDTLQSANGILTWSSFYDIFWWDEINRELREKRWPPGDPEPSTAESSLLRAKRLEPQRLLEISLNDRQSKVLVNEVTHFEVKHQGTDALVQPITVELEVTQRVKDASTMPLPVRQSITFHLVNQF